MSSRVFSRSDVLVLLGSVVAVAAAGVARYAGAPAVLAFVVAGAAVALLASVVGRSVEQLGDRFGPGATGVLQSALGNLPELFIGFFALQAGLIAVVQAAIIGSILSNILLVLGLSFLVGGLRNGPQRFDSERARTSAILMVLAVAALVLPSLAQYVHAPAAPHERELSLIVSVVLLGVFALSLPAALKRAPVSHDPVEAEGEVSGTRWPLWLAVTLLAASSVVAALVSDWFVHALEPAIEALGISQAFAGLVIVAIAGNAIENVVGIQLAYRNKADFAMAVIIQSPLQIALVLAPALVLLSLLTATTLTLVFAPMLVVAVAVTVIAVAFVVFDGESTWLEGVTLIALYAIIATAFWWG
ncbi:calcium/proton exchanger [Actinoplanes sp. KI2]|uniref:calcium/proton exchanger n=1 Tax=Actinoplanes sp. KI2 TaxID=2983315 RepID=UPI0021D5C766|nr:calcium/proton exchanger [Actinoplanes sp. KI2]MCU7730672.1 calcium/proton exchanger [Actinoplanes sp. KI2]